MALPPLLERRAATAAGITAAPPHGPSATATPPPGTATVAATDAPKEAPKELVLLSAHMTRLFALPVWLKLAAPSPAPPALVHAARLGEPVAGLAGLPGSDSSMALLPQPKP